MRSTDARWVASVRAVPTPEPPVIARRGSDGPVGPRDACLPVGPDPDAATLFLFSWVGQFIFQLTTERSEASQHGLAFEWADFLPQFLASTFENWQSEFLQLVWQAGGLALFFWWGSSQSRESDDRIEAKLDALLRDQGIDPHNP